MVDAEHGKLGYNYRVFAGRRFHGPARCGKFSEDQAVWVKRSARVIGRFRAISKIC